MAILLNLVKSQQILKPMIHWVEAVDVMSHTSHTHKTYTQQCSKCTHRFLDAVIGHVLMHSSCTLRFFFSIVAVSDTFFSAIFRSVPKHSKVNG